MSAETQFDSLPAPSIIFDTSGLLRHANKAWRSLGGRGSRNAIGLPAASLLEPTCGLPAGVWLADWPKTQHLPRWAYCRGTHPRLCLAFMSSRIEAGILLQGVDVSPALKRIRQLNELSLTDPLTGLLNRRGLRIRHSSLLNLAKRKGWPLIVLAIDLDNLKMINDMHGHRMGDRALEETATALRTVLPNEAVVARMGGDEFTALLVHPGGRETGEAVLRDLRRHLAGSSVSATTWQLSVSGGIRVLPVNEDLHLASLLQAADQDMYRDKSDRQRRPESKPNQPKPNQPFMAQQKSRNRC
ncbi:MAG: diguanylate cyclase [Deltaproteobacteria bacterium]|nr:diguanylate cyclase [Deltaproteobacteria bacterium]